MENIKGVNISEGLARFRGKTDRYFGALRKFAVGLTDGDIPFEEVVLPENITETGSRIHTLKGVAGNLSVTDVFAFCTDFESTLKAGNPSRELYEALCKACTEAKAQILEHIKTEDTLSDAKPGETATCVAMLRELRAAAETYDAASCDSIIKKLKAAVWENVDPAILSKILSLASDYEFDDAIELIDGLTANIS